MVAGTHSLTLSPSSLNHPPRNTVYLRQLLTFVFESQQPVYISCYYYGSMYRKLNASLSSKLVVSQHSNNMRCTKETEKRETGLNSNLSIATNRQVLAAVSKVGERRQQSYDDCASSPKLRNPGSTYVMQGLMYPKHLTHRRLILFPRGGDFIDRGPQM